MALEKGRIIFHRSDFSIPYRGPFIPLKQIIKFSPHGHTVVVERNVDPVAIALNKESLLEDLCADAQKRGVELVAGANALAVEQGDETVTITVFCEGKTLQRTGKAAIAADGVNSPSSASRCRRDTCTPSARARSCPSRLLSLIKRITSALEELLNQTERFISGQEQWWEYKHEV